MPNFFFFLLFQSTFRLSYQDDLAEIMMEKIEFSNFHSRHPEPLFYVNHEKVAELGNIKFLY